MSNKATKPPTEDPPVEAEANGADPSVEDPLDLTSIVATRRLVKVPTKAHPEGENFELRLLDDFGIQKQQQLLAWQRRFEQLFNSDHLRRGDADRLKQVLDQLFEEILDAPAAVKKAMPDGVRSRVVNAFSWAPRLALQQAAQQEREKTILAILIEKELVTQEQMDEVVAEANEQSSES